MGRWNRANRLPPTQQKHVGSVFGQQSDYGTKVMLDRNVYLVDVVNEKIGRVLKLDSIQGGKL
ncbi:hypothetical protein COLO4_32938 [Corchorus olitorius]|uniref:Uncharacterized protein n=1 Tax=Corchorus olitorius TaxID=93759 RepID=A0A1R3GX94_9ROSI|nr:hypothetical protein COLO4_32938 [Corchorus olitorius]